MCDTKFTLSLALFGLLLCAASATRGSISEHLFDDDVKDKPHAESDVVDQQEPEVPEERAKDPCHSHQCYRGEVCELDASGTAAQCVCNQDCSFYDRESRFQVCSNTNRTYPSECHLNRDHCLCKHNLPGCSQPGVSKIYLDYYNGCKEQLPCPESAAAQFPLRLRNWLFVIMEAMAKRSALGEYSDMVAEAAANPHHAHAVIWKFCDLDSDPQDSHVSKRELQYTVRSLRAMEGCLVPFLDGCDLDDNRMVTLEEWGRCLGLDNSEISDRCVAIQKHRRQ